MVSRRLLARAVADRLESGDSKKTIVEQLAAYMITHKLQKHIDAIVGDIEAELALRGTVAARITSARPLTDELRTQLTHYIKQVTDVSRVSLQETVDPGLIGGVIIQTPDKTLDISVASQLKRLKTT